MCKIRTRIDNSIHNKFGEMKGYDGNKLSVESKLTENYLESIQGLLIKQKVIIKIGNNSIIGN